MGIHALARRARIPSLLSFRSQSHGYALSINPRKRESAGRSTCPLTDSPHREWELLRRDRNPVFRGCKTRFVFLSDYPAFLRFVVLYRRKELIGRLLMCLASRSSSLR